MSRREQRRINKMHKQRERKENHEKRVGYAKKSLVVLGAAGVSYAGYQYRDELKNVAENVTTKAAEEIGRRTGNTEFQKKVQETKNVMEAVSGTYRIDRANMENTGRGFLRNLDPASREKEIRRRTELLNKSTGELMRKNNIPADIVSAKNELDGNKFEVYQEAVVKNFEKQMRYKKTKGISDENKENLIDIIRGSKKDRDSLFTDYESPENTDKKELKQDLLDVVLKFNKAEDTEISLGLKEESDVMELASNFQKAINSAKRETSEQQKDFRRALNYRKATGQSVDMSKLKGNTFAEETLYESSIRFKAVTERTKEEAKGFRKGLLNEGWENLTIADGPSSVFEKDGKLYIDSSGKKGSTTVDKMFSTSEEGKVGFSERMIEAGRQLGVDKSEVEKELFSKSLFKNPETGELLNLASIQNNLEDAAESMSENFQIPVIKINPLTYFTSQMRFEQNEPIRSAVYRKGNMSVFSGDDLETKQDILTRNKDSKGVLSKEYFQIGESIYDADIKEGLIDSSSKTYYESFLENLEDSKVADGYEIINTRKGTAKNLSDTISGRISEGSERSFLQEFIAMDKEQKTIWEEVKDVALSFEDANYGQNQPVAIASNYGQKDFDRASSAIENLGDKVKVRTYGLSQDSENATKSLIAEAIGKSFASEGIEEGMLDTQQGLIEISKQIAESHTRQSGSSSHKSVKARVLEDLEGQISRAYNAIEDDPGRFMDKRAYDMGNKLFESDLDNLRGSSVPVKYTGEDMLRGMIQQYGVISMDLQGYDLGEELSQNIFSNTKKVKEEVSELITRSEAIFFSNQMKSAKTPQAKEFVTEQWIDHFGIDQNAKNISSVMGKIEPFGRKGIETDFQTLTETNFMPIKKHKKLLRNINEGYTDFVETGQGTVLTPIFSALGDKVNTITGHKGTIDTGTLTPWALAESLNTQVGKYGLGVSADKRQSAASTVLNMAAYRMFMPVMAYNTAKSMDDFFLGGAGRKKAAQSYANMHIGMASIKDRTRLSGVSKWMDTYVPGMEHLRGSPVGQAARIGTFGLLGDGRSEEELQEYYESGEDPIRKGKWWRMGSTTPWIGDRTEYHRPNAYRRIMSDYEYTDTMHGSRREYWSNHWMPNIYNPLAPVNHFLLDPYHYEKKHAESRPYAATGGFSSIQAIPLIGQPIDSFVSSILKPSKTNPRLRGAHRDYLRGENERLVSAYMGPNTPGSINVTPRGKVSITTTAPQINIIDEDTGLHDQEALIADDIRFSTESAGIGKGGTPSIPGHASTQNVTVRDYIKGQLAGYNTSLAGVPKQGRSFSPSQVHDQINPYSVRNVSDVVNTTGFKDPIGPIMGTADQLKYMGGMRGFLSANVAGIETSDRRTHLETSSRYGNWNERFWDMGIGGMDGVGGGLSEIARRFIGGKQRQDYYNPIQNQMPDWMKLTFSINFFNCWKPLKP